MYPIWFVTLSLCSPNLFKAVWDVKHNLDIEPRALVDKYKGQQLDGTRPPVTTGLLNVLLI